MAHAENFTEDRLLGGQVTLFQPRKGFRAGTDSVLLAAALDGGLKGEALEIGCGAGAALFCAAHRLAEAQFTGVEVDANMVDLAHRGIEANDVTGRVQVLGGDAGDLPGDWENRFDLVYSNPPFFEPGRASPPGAGKAGAYTQSLTLDKWLKAMLFTAGPRAPIVLIHRAAELAGILAGLDRRAGEITVLPVKPYPGAEAKRVIIKARKGLRRGDVRLLDGLVLHREKGGPLTERAEAIMQGEALEWL